ncbi:MAG: hypothetical protein J5J06_06530 [Phycisphaerae bacterium]|nr:hypothetical protein [Phycisphaerae bacterium]
MSRAQLVLTLVRSLVCDRAEAAGEKLGLRQPLAVLREKTKRRAPACA